MSDSPPPISKPPESLDQPVNEQLILELYGARLLTSAARDAALTALRPQQHWWRWANRSLLFVGSALLLAGVIFFFAHNWARMHPVAKFCLIETGLWICAFGAWRRGLEKLSGKVLLLAASVLVGVLLAVYGQVYQTGADAFENYVLWALLILLWVIIARFAALWILWLVVTNAALILFFAQTDLPRDWEAYLFLLLGIWNGTALAAREYGASRGLGWLGGSWTRELIWFAILFFLTIPTMVMIVGEEYGQGTLAGAFGLLVAMVAGQMYFRRVAPDVLSLGFNLLALCIVLLTFIGKVLFEASDGAPAFLVFGLIVLGTSSAAAFYLRYVARIIGDDETG